MVSKDIKVLKKLIREEFEDEMGAEDFDALAGEDFGSEESDETIAGYTPEEVIDALATVADVAAAVSDEAPEAGAEVLDTLGLEVEAGEAPDLGDTADALVAAVAQAADIDQDVVSDVVEARKAKRALVEAKARRLRK